MPEGYVGQQSLVSVAQVIGRHGHWHHARNCLEVGCGSGAFAVYLCSNLPDLVVCGIDSDPSAIASADQLASAHSVERRAEFLIHDFDTPGDVFEARYDVVLSTDAIQHSQNPQRLIDRLIACWRGSGRFFVSAWTFESTKSAQALANSWGVLNPQSRLFYLDNRVQRQHGLSAEDCSETLVTRVEASLASLFAVNANTGICLEKTHLLNERRLKSEP